MGKFEIFENIGNEKVKIGEQENRILYGGRMYALDSVFGLEAWQSGVAGYDGAQPGSGLWNPYRTIVIGVSADDNNNWLEGNGYLIGDSGISGFVGGGEAYGHLPNLTDTYMTSAASGDYIGNDYNVGYGLFFKRADSTIRVGRTVSIQATFFSTADPGSIGEQTILAGTEIRELGVSLSDNPTGLIDPITDRTSRPHTLICRSVRFEVSGTHIIDNPIIVGSNDITVRYTFGDVV
jgi:hypothetical protein